MLEEDEDGLYPTKTRIFLQTGETGSIPKPPGDTTSVPTPIQVAKEERKTLFGVAHLKGVYILLAIALAAGLAGTVEWKRLLFWQHYTPSSPTEIESKTDEVLENNESGEPDTPTGRAPLVDEGSTRGPTGRVQAECVHVYFDTNSSRLRTAGRRALDEMIDSFHWEDDYLVNIAGKADFRGKESLNNKLSLQRAESAWKYLASKGIPAGSMEIRGLGEGPQRNIASTSKDRWARVCLSRK